MNNLTELDEFTKLNQKLKKAKGIDKELIEKKLNQILCK